MNYIDGEIADIEKQLFSAAIALDALTDNTQTLDTLSTSYGEKEHFSTVDKIVVNGMFDSVETTLGYEHRKIEGIHNTLSGEALVESAKKLGSAIYQGIAAMLSKVTGLVKRLIDWVMGLFGKSGKKVSATKAVVESAGNAQKKAIADAGVNVGDKLTKDEAKKANVMVDAQGKVIDPNIIVKNLTFALGDKRTGLQNKSLTPRQTRLKTAFASTAVKGKTFNLILNTDEGLTKAEALIKNKAFSKYPNAENIYGDIAGGKLDIKSIESLFDGIAKDFDDKKLFTVKGRQYVGEVFPGLKKLDLTGIFFDKNKSQTFWLKASEDKKVKIDGSFYPELYSEFVLSTEVLSLFEERIAKAETILKSASAEMDSLSKFSERFGAKGQMATDAIKGYEDKGDKAHTEFVKRFVTSCPKAIASASFVIKFAVDRLNDYKNAAEAICDETREILKEIKA